MTAYPDLASVPTGHYRLIYADPAWYFKTHAPQEKNKHRRDAGRHYQTMTAREMKAMDVGRVADRDCWLFMWTTWPHLWQAFELAQAWGFRYSSSGFVWFKMRRAFSPTRAFITLPNDMHFGPGYTTRKNTEPCLLFRKGAPKRLSASVAEPIFAPVREHSRKPDEAYGRLEAFCAGPRLEMNARTERPSWDQWGNEVGKFEQPDALSVHDEAEPEQRMLPWRPGFTIAPGVDDASDDANVVPMFRRAAP